MTKIHLICNAHIDPVYLWEWEEGAAEALATFRTAADFCERCDGFVFNKNEVILYEWVKEFDPSLFTRIQKLVQQGKWHIMGGWYVQPDCNMPAGESLVRQILRGREFFLQHFNTRPTTAINFDPFGHSGGLVQILVKSGFDSYLFCRPEEKYLNLPAPDFLWTGPDGSRIRTHRAMDLYKSRRGAAVQRIDEYLEKVKPTYRGLVLWGIGNHGGGPSAEDLDAISQNIERWESKGWKIGHSTPEAYFNHYTPGLPEFEGDLNPFAVGCYTSQIRIKQSHRALENALFLTEKMAGRSALAAGMEYPQHELQEAEDDLLLSEFHDILPGTSIQSAEESSLRLMGHGLEILSRIRMKSFLQLCRAVPDAITLFTNKQNSEPAYSLVVYNPHPWEFCSRLICELQLADQNLKGSFTDFRVVDAAGREIPCQVEKEASNIPVDWRKRLVLKAPLKPSALTTLKCLPREIEKKAPPHASGFVFETASHIKVKGQNSEFVVSKESGALIKMDTNNETLLAGPSCVPIVLKDSSDPWGVNVDRFDMLIGSFELMSPEETSGFCALDTLLPPVHIVESGRVRTVVECCFKYKTSSLVMRYSMLHDESRLEVDMRVNWQEKDKMLKAPLYAIGQKKRCFGQTAYAVQEYTEFGRENVSQKWTALLADIPEAAGFAVLDRGMYGFHFDEEGLYLSLLRSPAYSAYPVPGTKPISSDRYTPRIDQGEHRFRFDLLAGPSAHIRQHVDRRALEINEEPFYLFMSLSNSPTTDPTSAITTTSEAQDPQESFIKLDNPAVVMTAFKRSRSGLQYVIRLHETSGTSQTAVLRLPQLDLHNIIDFSPFEIKTFLLDPVSTTLTESDLLEGLSK
jgi:alpha-mannosidase